jgi:catechol 2,3-dioxygenase
MAIAADTTVGPVTLTVRDTERVASFYEQVLGLHTLDRRAATTALGVEEGRPLVELVHDPDAPPRPPGTTGLFHLALLVPSRLELARSLRRIADAGWRLTGASDHLVSEALYLDDPEGNGIEIYRDRPRAEWRRDGDEITMATLPLDIDGLIGELGSNGDDAEELAPATRIGHVHLNVADLDESERFYGGLLGFDVTARGYPGALFLSAGGYHHHIGLNIWAGAGAPPPAAGSSGLRAFAVVLPDRGELERVTALLEAGGAAVETRDGTASALDPSGNRLLLSGAG